MKTLRYMFTTLVATAGCAWGTLAAGIFNIAGTRAGILAVQRLGIAACFLWTFPTALIKFKLIDKTIGLRVSPEEDAEGQDFAEHGGNAYPDVEVSAMSRADLPVRRYCDAA